MTFLLTVGNLFWYYLSEFFLSILLLAINRNSDSPGQLSMHCIIKKLVVNMSQTQLGSTRIAISFSYYSKHFKLTFWTWSITKPTRNTFTKGFTVFFSIMSDNIYLYRLSMYNKCATITMHALVLASVHKFSVYLWAHAIWYFFRLFLNDTAMVVAKETRGMITKITTKWMLIFTKPKTSITFRVPCVISEELKEWLSENNNLIKGEHLLRAHNYKLVNIENKIKKSWIRLLTTIF